MRSTVMRSVLCVLIANNNEFGRTEIELLSAGQRLASDLGGTLAATVLGPAGEGWLPDCFAYGARRVFLAENSAQYHPRMFAAAVQHIAQQASAEVVLFPSTTFGLEVAPLVAYGLGAAMVMDVVGMQGMAEGGGVEIHKPVFGGKAESVLIARRAPLVLALRMRSFAASAPDSAAQGEVVKLPLDLGAAPGTWRVLERQVEKEEGVRLEEARVVVSGGRGLGGKENFACLEELGNLMGAALGASRAAVDLGWVPSTWQIGQTGKKVAPELYLAVGISGASQHMVGVAGAKHVVAINKDEKAPIFQVAELGVVEDYKAFIPKLIEALKKRSAAAPGT